MVVMWKCERFVCTCIVGKEGGGGRGVGVGRELSLVPVRAHLPARKDLGERSRISWAYYPKAVKTNEIARSVITL